jgi:ketosteroid isomerase-like protein
LIIRRIGSLNPDISLGFSFSFGLTFNLKHILFGLHGVALSLNNTAKRSDIILDEHLATVFVLRDGKIAAINTYLSDVEMLNRFFA